MNYQKLHDSILDKYQDVKTREEAKALFGGFSERHHKIPKSIGGPDTDENQVYLPLRVHFLIHRLLHKIHPRIYEFKQALSFMSNGKNKDKYFISSREYDRLRSAWYSVSHSEETKMKISLSKTGKPLSLEHKEKIRKTLIGRPVSEESRRKSSIKQSGRKKTPEQIEKTASKLRGRIGSHKGMKRSDESRKKMSEAHIGKKLSPESVAKRSNTVRGRHLSDAHKLKMSETRKRNDQMKKLLLVQENINGG